MLKFRKKNQKPLITPARFHSLSVVGQHVQYLEWSFCFRMSTASGPQLWDVRWAGQRIVYEISLQEMVVLYAGADPKTFFSHLSDSAFGLGEKVIFSCIKKSKSVI